MKKLLLSIFAVAVSAGYLHALELSGKVVNIHTNKGLQNIKITAVSDIHAFEEFNAVTNAEGFFSISGLKKNSRYTVKALSSDNSAITPKSKTIHTSKTDISGCDFAYYPRYSISGTINSGSIKTSGLKIMFKSGAPFYDSAVSYVNENGGYKAYGLIYGQEYYAFVSSDFHVYAIAGDNLITASDNNVKDMDIVQVFYGIGKVFDHTTKTGLSDIIVKAVNSDGRHEISAVTSADGSFIFADLHYGESYKITAEPQPGFELPDEIKTGTVKSTVTDLNFSFISK
ncbi:MAG: hypothetical protein FWH43_05060 [Endomicrobia bacterium]|nr:hypothetical protein [Endomicrobiia bacterium]